MGINLAIQDAVATARILGPVLRHRSPTSSDLRRVQRRRTWPVIVTQAVQRRMQRPLLSSSAADAPLAPLLRVIRDHPKLTRVTGRFIGMGARPERLG